MRGLVLRRLSLRDVNQNAELVEGTELTLKITG